MANPFKVKQRERPAWTAAEQAARLNKALGEGRTQQALELARALFKHEATTEHLDLVRKATMARARHLRQSGQLRDAATMLVNAIDLGGTDFLKEVAAELSHCGALRQAQELMAQVGDPKASAAMLAGVADAAMRQGAAGRNLLPEEHRQHLDLVRQAFTQMQAGQDETVRTALQGIGLQSPFLEWKLFLRGLLAYYQNDDVRAVENWTRLDSARLPFRLAAPFRYQIDPQFRQAQAPVAQTQLHRAADQLQSSPVAASLRQIRSLIGNEKTLPQAFRVAEKLLPVLRQHSGALVPRLAACFYWAIITHGSPEDKSRYQRVFGTPADDPELTRLDALALEINGQLDDAHSAWQEFESWLENSPAWGTAELRTRARALIWSRMGMNAERAEISPALPSFVPFSIQPPGLTPNAEQCFRKALTLAPDRLGAHKALLAYYLEDGKHEKAIKTARGLLERFPDDVPTLTALAELCRTKGEHDESVRLLQRALEVNPLERKLRMDLGTAHLSRARALATRQQFEAARADYQTALALLDPVEKPGVLCRWAAAEFKAKNGPRAEELLVEAGQSGRTTYIAYYMAIEAARCKLPAPLKKRFTTELAAGMEQATDNKSALDLLDLTVSHVLTKVEYSGRKTHEKKILAHVEKLLTQPWTEDELERLCDGLVHLGADKLLKKVVRRGKAAYPASPAFALKSVKLILNTKPSRSTFWKLQQALRNAQRLTAALPPGDRQARFLKEIQELEQVTGNLNPIMERMPVEYMEELLDAFFEG